MYKLVRKTHLYIALSLFLSTLMYFFSGYVMIHTSWFGRPDAQVTTEIRTMPRPLSGKEPNISEYLQSEYNLRGKRLPSMTQEDGTLRFEYWRPGEGYNVILTPNSPEVVITRRQWQWQETMIGFHRMHNYDNGWIYTTWAFLLDLVSVAMIVLGLSGIYMWYKLTKKRLPGWIILTITYSYTLATILYLIYAP